ncbi:MAG: MmcQ/YjbR family DNA-binding protein [Acidobacteriota bacterium]
MATKKKAIKKAARVKAVTLVKSKPSEQMTGHPVHTFTTDGENHLQRVRQICTALPETTEKLSHGSPTFFRNKVYCTFTHNHHRDGRVAVWIPAAPGDQELLIRSAPEVYFRPPYVGVGGWVGICLDQIGDEELGIHLLDAWKLVAAKPRRDAS